MKLFYIIAEPKGNWLFEEYELKNQSINSILKNHAHLLIVELEKQEHFYTKPNESIVWSVVLRSKGAPDFYRFYINPNDYVLYFFEEIKCLFDHPNWDKWQNYDALKNIEYLI